MAALIKFLCQTPGHQQRNGRLSSPITMHRGEWSFCPAGADADHAWEQIPGTTREALGWQISHRELSKVEPSLRSEEPLSRT